MRTREGLAAKAQRESPFLGGGSSRAVLAPSRAHCLHSKHSTHWERAAGDTKEEEPLCPLAPWGPPGIRALYRERGSNGSALKGGLEIPALTPTGFGQNGRLRRKIRGGSRGSTCVVMLLEEVRGGHEGSGEERSSYCLKMAPSPEG